MDEHTTNNFPTLGTHMAGGKYAGVTTGKDGVPYALISLPPSAPRRMNWNDAMAFAEESGASLPNRVEAAMLFANIPDDFDQHWIWLGEQSSPISAWIQYFDDGDQYANGKGGEGVVRLVLRLPIGTFVL
jgi:hypothetical protein